MLSIQWFNHIPPPRMSSKNGFGYATERITSSLTNLGYEVNYDHGWTDADVFITFDQPHHIKQWPSDKYNICYFPWESSKLMPEWYEIVNGADEVWVPSPLIASWLEADDIRPPVYVFEHGVDKIWTPKERKVSDKIKFLHLGFESARKYGPQTLYRFRKAFQNNDDVSLTLKMWMPSWGVGLNGKINTLNKILSVQELVELFHDHHIFLFMSAGEGFGLPTLQSLATGMPTIINGEWAPYKKFIDPRLDVPSCMKLSNWQDLHPGEIFRPDFDDMVDKMRWAVDNYEDISKYAMSQVDEIATRYDWDTLTNDAFKSLEKRLK